MRISPERMSRRGDHTHINTEDAYKPSMDSIEKKVIHMPPTYSGGYIYRVPETLRKVNEKAYTPKIVSIGPFHRDNQNLKAMENHKGQYMRDLFGRWRQPRIIFDDCCKAIWGLKDIISKSYAPISKSYAPTIDFESNDFLEMMLLDGCFILELLLKYSNKKLRDKNDPLFNQPWMINAVKRDLLLLENQIPFTIIESLYDQLAVTLTSYSLANLTLLLFPSVLSSQYLLVKSTFTLISGKHLLDYLHNIYRPSSGQKREPIWKIIPCVTDLIHAGIDFKKGIDGDLFDASFSHGVLTIPPLSIQDNTESFFRNLIALEQCCHGMDHYITSYVMFMDFLINSPQDVKLLQGQRIIINHLGDEEAVSVLFNNLCKEVTITGFYFTELFDQVDKYYQKRRHKWKAIFKRNYFSNPWKIISLIGAIILLILTIGQTVFSVLSYYSPN